ncbi:GAF domain-containing protein [Lachnospiraceae bacterium YH-ros2228]|jgi:L-methionine (R)-S-oxide reductase|nr:GAF domain-containing protein [Lachnospiraceae bacterium]MDD6448889.1 GAF domain-containing protein [Lachnospiraceae bacterium]
MNYSMIAEQIRALCAVENGWVPVFSNASAVLFQEMPDVSWAGFYVEKNGSLLIGPFQGKMACIRIPHDKGVCGSAYAKDTVMLVRNVHEFPGHIACDSASNSEIVLPIHGKTGIVAVLDIDSTSIGRFTEEDREGLLQVVKVFEECVDLNI